MHNHQVSISGGSDKIRYAASGGYLNQDGVVLGSGFKRATARVNLDVDAFKWLSFGVNSSLSTYKQTNTIEKNNTNSLDDNVLMIAVRQYPDVPVRNADGTFGYVDKSKYDTGGTPISNPVSDALTRERYNRGTDVGVNAFADLKFYKDLTLRVEYGTSFNFNKTYAFLPFYDYGTYVQQSSGSRDASQSKYYSFKTYLTYNHTWDKHTSERGQLRLRSYDEDRGHHLGHRLLYGQLPQRQPEMGKDQLLQRGYRPLSAEEPH